MQHGWQPPREVQDSREQPPPTHPHHRSLRRPTHPKSRPPALTITFPCILAVLIIAFSFILPQI